MRLWIASFIVLFILAQFGLWVKSILLPLPFAIFGGAFLALASNYDKGISDPNGDVNLSLFSQLKPPRRIQQVSNTEMKNNNT
ncbi:MAG: hypothetical protein AAGG02_13305 [Cyanobacteria bacterium P01_H01_bin.15]